MREIYLTLNLRNKYQFMPTASTYRRTGNIQHAPLHVTYNAGQNAHAPLHVTALYNAGQNALRRNSVFRATFLDAL